MQPTAQLAALAAVILLVTGGARAQGASLFDGGDLQSARQPLIPGALAGQPNTATAARPLIQARSEEPGLAPPDGIPARAQSLFVGRASGSLFAPSPSPSRGAPPPTGSGLGTAYGGDSRTAMLRNLIAQAEAGPAGYDAVQLGATRTPDRPPTQMTLGDIFAWIEATPGQPHAIGRYQFIPSTLARLVDHLGASLDERFSPQLQDRLADLLLHEAGLAAYRSGEMTRHAFMNNLARIWAGLPSSTGRSHYHGYAGNAATMTWSQFDSEMARIFQS